MKKKFLVLLIIVAILGSIGVYLWTNDMIYFSGKDVDGIYVEEELRIATDDYYGISYCKLLKKAIDGNQEDIKKIMLLDFSGAGAAGYDHGDVLVKLIDRLGEETIISSLGNQLTKKEKRGINSNLADNKNKYEKATILISLRWSHAHGMRTAEQTRNDYGFRRQRKGGTL